MEFIFLIVWACCGVASAVIAYDKGRIGCIWFIVGIVLGVFGLILAIAVPNMRESKEREAASIGAMRCRYCAQPVICNHCGRDL